MSESEVTLGYTPDNHNELGSEAEPPVVHHDVQSTKVIVDLIGDLSARVPTERDIEGQNLSGMEKERKELQLAINEVISRLPLEGRSALETEAWTAMRKKMAEANGLTVVSGRGEHVTLEPSDRHNLYNRLVAIHEKLCDAHLIARLMAHFDEEVRGDGARAS